MSKKFVYLIAITSVMGIITACAPAPDDVMVDRTAADPPTPRPNILLIVADDLGFTDLGSFGSEIRTPHIDSVADSGLQFTRFYVAPNCSPTRAMLMTGVENHLTGQGNMLEHLAENQRGQPGYEGYLNERVVTVAQLLNDAGYHTYMTGKWHLGMSAERSPAGRGFEQSFALGPGGATHFDEMLGLKRASPHGKRLYWENGRNVEFPAGAYSSAFYTDRLMDYINAGLSDGRPFFAYLAFTAVHWPLQVPDEDLDLYRDRYSAGYDRLREQRLAGAKRVGVLSDGTRLGPGSEHIPAWDSLSDDEKRIAARTMEIYAAMVENMDRHVGRLIDFLRDRGIYENTLIIFMSDNGAEGSDRINLPGNDQWIAETFDNSYRNLGRRMSYIYTGPGWAQASSVPSRLYKGFTAEGGIRSPLIVSWPGQFAAGTHRPLATVRDIPPTILELAGIEHPGTRYAERDILPMSGRSLLPVLRGTADAVHPEDEVIGWEQFGHRAVRRGDWKLTWIGRGFGPDRWQLYNLADDPAEARDLADRFPDKLAEMIGYWEDYRRENGVILPTAIDADPH